MDDLDQSITNVRTGVSERKPDEPSPGRLLPDHFYGPPTLEKLEQRIIDLAQKIEADSIDVVGLIDEVGLLREQVHRIASQLDNVQEETGMRADRIAIKAVA